MIHRFKIGDCSNPACLAENVPCVKVGKRMVCVKCRQLERAMATLKKTQTKLNRAISGPKKKEDLERTYLIEDLDFFTSQYIRKVYAAPSGVCECYTCGKKDRWQNLDCGHFIPRQNMSLRWDLRNLRPQCKTCNQLESGNLREFARELELECPGLVEQLEAESREIKKWTREELKEALVHIRSKIKSVDNKFNN